MNETPATVDESAPVLTCPECGEEKPSSLTLGLHRRQKHGIAGRDKRNKKRDPGIQRPTGVSVIRDIADDAGANRRTTGAPTQKELTEAFGRANYTVSQAVAIYAVESDRRRLTDQQREEMVDYLALSRTASNDVTEPLARAFHRSPINRRAGRAVVDNVDVAGSVAELAIMFAHWRRYFAERRAWEEAVRQGAVPMQQQPPAPAAASNGASPNGATPPSAPASGDDLHGIVWTKETVDAMKRSHG